MCLKVICSVFCELKLYKFKKKKVVVNVNITKKNNEIVKFRTNYNDFNKKSKMAYREVNKAFKNHAVKQNLYSF